MDPGRDPTVGYFSGWIATVTVNIRCTKRYRYLSIHLLITNRHRKTYDVTFRLYLVAVHKKTQDSDLLTKGLTKRKKRMLTVTISLFNMKAIYSSTVHCNYMYTMYGIN